MHSNPLKWHGGKHYLARRIIESMPTHVHYVEPFFGGGAVLFAKPVDGVSEVINDIDGDLMNFWDVLKNEQLFAELQRHLEATPIAQPAWQAAKNACDRGGKRDRIQRAADLFVRYRQSRQGLGRDFATLSRNRTRRGMNEQASSWLSAIEGLPEAHARLQRVVLLCDDACEVIRRQDGPNTHFYCDPPYLHDTRTVQDAYRHEMSAEQHVKLLETLAGIKGTFQLSGYDSLIYSTCAITHRWRRADFELPNHASGAATKRRMVESIWMNYGDDRQ